MTWIAGDDGVVLGWGDTSDDAVEDAMDFCNGDDASALEVVLASTALEALVTSKSRPIEVRYVVQAGVAYLPQG